MTKKYKLLKPLPDAEVGTIYEKEDDMYYGIGLKPIRGIRNGWFQEEVETNPLWFSEITTPETKQETERVEVTRMVETKMGVYESNKGEPKLTLYFNKPHDRNKNEAIRDAVEKVLNEPKPEPPNSRGWEIVCFTKDGRNYWRRKDGNYTHLPFDTGITERWGIENMSIWEVRRLSDGESFYVGADITWGEVGTYRDKIVSFAVVDDKMSMKTEKQTRVAPNFLTLFNLQKIPPQQSTKEVLFVTEDGVDAVIGETYYKVTPMEGCWKADKTIMRIELANPPSYFKYFSTEEKAKEYILLNKPCLSVNDIITEIKKSCDKTYYNKTDEWDFPSNTRPQELINNITIAAQLKTNTP